MTLDTNTGELSAPRRDGPRTLRELIHLVDNANQAAANNGIAIEYVIIVQPPARTAANAEVSFVEVLARGRLRSRLADSESPRLPDHGGGGDFIVDIGVGRGSFGAELAERREGQVVVQTEQIGLAEAGQISRELPGVADAGPLSAPGSVMMYADVLGRPDLLRGSAAEAGTEGIHRVFMNNISAHFKEPDTLTPQAEGEYADLARHLIANMADGGTVEVQWTDTPENKAGDPRGHIRGDLLADTVESLLAGSDRAIERSEPGLSPVPYRYTVNSSRRSQAGADALAEFDAPEPRYRIVITFLGRPVARPTRRVSP